tara:strand:+ start:498 stop:1403 length:906 start_codon:yes stop_codon:yes gene_type:complete
MPKVSINGVDVAFTEHGDPKGPTLLMIQGLGLSSAAWPPSLITALTVSGFHIITFDNRDSGLSQKMPTSDMPNFLLQYLRSRLGLRVTAPYQMTDMMRDVVGLLDNLKVNHAHVIGMSMGGIIAQLLAIHEPRCVKSLVSIMSTTGRRRLPGPTWAVGKHMLSRPRNATKEAGVEYLRILWRLLGSPRYPVSNDELDGYSNRLIDRGMTAEGMVRQRLAVMAAPSRVADLAKLDVPSLIIHGDADPLIPVECGMDTANSIPGARMEIFYGMGHDLPEMLVPAISSLIIDHVLDADSHCKNK